MSEGIASRFVIESRVRSVRYQNAKVSSREIGTVVVASIIFCCTVFRSGKLERFMYASDEDFPDAARAWCCKRWIRFVTKRNIGNRGTQSAMRLKMAD